MIRSPYTTVELVAKSFRKSTEWVMQQIRERRLVARKTSSKANSSWLIEKTSVEIFLASLSRREVDGTKEEVT